MFGSSVSKISMSSNETLYISPVFNKDKIKPVKKIRRYKGKVFSTGRISKRNKAKMRDIFPNANNNETSSLIYDYRESKYMSDYIFMGQNLDEIF